MYGKPPFNLNTKWWQSLQLKGNTDHIFSPNLVTIGSAFTSKSDVTHGQTDRRTRGQTDGQMICSKMFSHYHCQWKIVIVIVIVFIIRNLRFTIRHCKLLLPKEVLTIWTQSWEIIVNLHKNQLFLIYSENHLPFILFICANQYSFYDLRPQIFLVFGWTYFTYLHQSCWLNEISNQIHSSCRE